MKFELPKLPYEYDTLQPFIDATTMETHYTKHHQTYVDKLNEALQKHPEVKVESLESLLSSLDTLPLDIRTAVRNHGGGHHNHSLFWTIMASPKKGGGGEPTGELAKIIVDSFGSFQKFKEGFSKAAVELFGSGWVWVTSVARGHLVIMTTPNQDTPLREGTKPILGLDVWEHAYYLKYRNRRGEYVGAWWNVVNWEEVQKRFETRE